MKCAVILTYKTLGIVRTFFIQRRRIFDELFSTFKLTVLYLSHIVPILEGEGYNEMLLQTVFINPSVFIECLLIILDFI